MQTIKVILLTAISFLYLILSGFAQNAGKISGTVISKDEKNISGATVSLLRAKDSSTIKLSVANKDGGYSFENIPAGRYLIFVTATGHRKATSPMIEISAENQNIQAPAISLIPVSKSLADVNVVAKRPLVEQRIDRTIVNVDASITNIGTSAMEVLEKSPGITVDREGNISLKGKDGVMVLIDGRPTQLGGADLANLLRNMSSNQMDQVEIMTNPPARYDAAGNAGIINIKTKKLNTAGQNGTLSLSYNQGRFARSSEGIMFNFREGKINLFTNLSHNYQRLLDRTIIKRNIYNSSTNALEKYFDQNTDKNASGNFLNGKIGVDFFATKKTTFGLVVSGASRPTSVSTDNRTEIMNPSKVLESVTNAVVDNSSDWKSFSTNFNFRTLLDKKGKELTADLDYLSYGSAVKQFMVNSYYDAAGHAVSEADSLNGDLPQNIKVYSGRVDYLHPISKTSRFEAGIKSSIVKTDNNAIYDSIINGNAVRDLGRSNYFVYEENVNAAYVSMNTALSKKLSAQFGLRLENTNATGRQLTTGEDFDRHYTQLFPTAYFQYKPSDKNNFVLNYGRRVRRPNYESLNPFIRFIDRYTYSQGNPNLKAQVTDNFELTHNYKNLLTTTLNYSSSNDNIIEVFEQKGPEAYTIPTNSASFKQYGLSITANTPVNKWWTSNINFNGFHNEFKSVVSNTALDYSAISFIIMSTQQFRITETFSAELTGRIRSAWLEGFMKAKPIAFMWVGFSKQMMKNKATLKFTVRDVFHSQIFRGTSKYGNVDVSFRQVNDTRVASLGFSYRFAKGKKIAPTKRTSGSANEEQERIGQ